MANLRANKIVSTTGSNAITGSVEFDGSGGYLSLSDNSDFNFSNQSFTVEGWFNLDKSRIGEVWILGQLNSNGDPSQGTLGSITVRKLSTTEVGFESQLQGDLYHTSGQISATSGAGSTITSRSDWTHFAFVRDNDNMKMYVNGISGTSVNVSGLTARDATGNFSIGRGGDYANNIFSGFISNLRIVKGTALYTSDFIPPTRELKKVPGTVLLCCQNPSSATQEATGKTITVNGNATARNFAPAVGSDGSIEFVGPTKINTENYFYLPTGNTEDRGRGRGVFGGGYVPGTSQNTIQFINIQSQGNAQDFGDLSSNMGASDGKAPVAAASAIRALFAGGYSAPTGVVNTIEYVTIATTSNSTDFGDLLTRRRDLGACASSTRALFGGGTTTGSTNSTNVVEYVTIASLGNTVSFGTLTQARRGVSSCSSSTRGIFGGGYVGPHTNRIDYVTIASTGNAVTFGDLTVVRGSTTSCSSASRGIFGGGQSPTFTNTIDYVTIATIGNAQDFGDLTSTRGYIGSCSNSTRGVFGGGGNPTHVNTMEFVLIASTGNATDFGDLLSAALFYNGGCSDSHGGLG